MPIKIERPDRTAARQRSRATASTGCAAARRPAPRDASRSGPPLHRPALGYRSRAVTCQAIGHSAGHAARPLGQILGVRRLKIIGMVVRMGGCCVQIDMFGARTTAWWTMAVAFYPHGGAYL